MIYDKLFLLINLCEKISTKLTCALVQVGGTVNVDGNLFLGYYNNLRHGTYKLGGGTLEVSGNERISPDCSFIQTGGVHNIGTYLYLYTNAVFRGWGVVKTSNGHLDSSGTIVGDGYGVDHSLVITNYDRLSIATANPAEGTNGFYAVNHGKLTLTPIPTSGSSAYQTWGGYGAPTLINAVQFSGISMTDHGTLLGSLYAIDNSEVPEYGRSSKIAGIWGFDDSADSVGGTADMKFRYDQVAVSNLGLDEASISMSYNAGGVDDDWEVVTNVTRDTAANTITLNDVNPVGFFALGDVQPGAPRGTTIIIR